MYVSLGKWANFFSKCKQSKFFCKVTYYQERRTWTRHSGRAFRFAFDHICHFISFLSCKVQRGNNYRRLLKASKQSSLVEC